MLSCRHPHRILLILISITFIVSGLLKGIDPYGTSLKIEEYLTVFGLSPITGYANVMAIVLCGFELLIGFALLLGLMNKLSLGCAIVMLTFFTLITIITTLFPRYNVAECGCFGELIPMSSKASLIKNMILLGAAVICWHKDSNESDRKRHPILVELMMLLCATLFSFGLPTYNTIELPIVDMGGYKRGIDVQTKPEFKIVDNGFRDVTKNLIEIDNCSLVVQKEEFTLDERISLTHIRENSHLKGADLMVVRCGNFEEVPDYNYYDCSAILTKSLVRSRHNVVILLERGIITKKILLRNAP